MSEKKKVYIQAGEYAFSKRGTQIHTLLGSCISITLWHPQLTIGGMCHFALPRSPNPDPDRLDPRYADQCIELFKASAKKRGTRITEYVAKIFGGGNMRVRNAQGDPDREDDAVGTKNAAAAYEFLMAEGVEIAVANVGEYGYRRVIFDVGTGDVWVRFHPAGSVGRDLNSLMGAQ